MSTPDTTDLLSAFSAVDFLDLEPIARGWREGKNYHATAGRTAIARFYSELVGLAESKRLGFRQGAKP